MNREEKMERNFSKEQMNVHSDFLEKLPYLPLSRNDPCACGSGLKYKKCCLTKNRNSIPSSLRLESFEIKTDALTPEESQNNVQAVTSEDMKLIADLYHTFHDHPDVISSEDCEYFQKLNALHAKYPDNPMILNYITKGYDHLGQEDRVEELIIKTHEKFPDYLFAQTARASLYLRDGLHEEALKVLKGAYTLKQLYPHRTVFHISEVRAFENFMVKYFCEIRNFEQANIHLEIMQKILEEDDALLQDTQNLLKKSRAFYNLKTGLSRLFGLRKRSETKDR